MRKYDNMMGDLSAGSGECNYADREFGIWFLNNFRTNCISVMIFAASEYKGMVKV